MAEIVVNLVINKLGPLLVKEIKLLRGVRQEIEDVKEELKSIGLFLKDAEKRSAIEELEGNNNSDVQQWVAQVREVAYCIEDVLDEFAFTVARLPHGRGIVGILRKANRSLNRKILRHNIVNDIQKIKESLVRIQNRRKRYGLDSIHKESDDEKRNVTRQGGCGVGSYYTEEDHIVGYESIRKELMDLMVNKIPQRRVIVLVGAGGLGKTTLAASLYKKNDLKNHFDCHAWIHVGKTYIKEDLLRRTIQKIYSSLDENAPGNMEIMDEMGLIDMLRTYLEKKSYMVVFDDVWKDEFWKDVEHALPDNHKSSRLIITTRHRVVANFLPTYVVHTSTLKSLPWDKAWQLFCMTAFNSDRFCPPELEELSNKILRKCGGLPFAIVAVGGLLSMKNKIVTEWEKLFNNLGEDLGSDPYLRSCNRVLSESFNDLPHHLKPCLLYFGLFPESYSIRCGRLIRLWIAEGFVQFQSDNSNRLEEIGQEYLTELIERNLVHVSETKQGKPFNCRVQNLMHEIILKKTEQSGFSRILNEHNMSQCTKTRRLTISESTDNVLKRINDSKVRSLFLSNIVELPRSFMSTISADNFKLMRVLDFEDAPIDYVPEGVGSLFHLHYLSLKNTKVKILPKTIGKLLNLETLNLKNTLVGELPVEIKKLKKLRYLVIKRSDSPYLSYGEGSNIQKGFGSLIDLQKLCGVRLNSKMLEELKMLRQLRKLGVQLVNGNRKDIFSSIANMNYLKTLCIELTNRDEIFDIESVASPPKYLERLYLLGNLNKLPDWIFNLQNLAMVCLARSDFTDDPMRVLHNLPNLLELNLSEAYNGEQLHIKQGWFPKLLVLYLLDLKGLKFITIEDGAMSLLKTLVISACPLKVIPIGVENLRNLSFLHFRKMFMEIMSNSTFVTYEMLEKLKHIPQVLFSFYDNEEKFKVMNLEDIWYLQCKHAEALPENEGEASSSQSYESRRYMTPQTGAPTLASTPAAVTQTQAPTSTQPASAPSPAPAPAPAAPAPAPSVTATTETDVYGQAASNLDAGNNLEGTIQQILDMGGGTWDRDIVLRALRAAFNNPERAVEYLYSGIPEQAEVPPVARVPGGAQGANPPAQAPQPTQPTPVPSSGPNANPLDLFPQGLPDMGSGAAGVGSLEFLRSSQQFQALRAMVQANPQMLQPMLQELGIQNPQLMRLIQEHQDDFLRLINEPVEGGEWNIGSQLAAAMPQSVAVTPEEREAIEHGSVFNIYITPGGPNANPLDLFPQGPPNMGSGAAGVGSLEFLRSSQQFQALRAMVQANPQMLQPMLQELGIQNPQLMRLIQEHRDDFLRLINEPVEGGEWNIGSQLAAAMPQSVAVTPEEREAIEHGSAFNIYITPSGGPNANPLDLFPQGPPNMGSGAAGVGSLEFLRSSQQFQALRAMVQANPQMLQPMLQELGIQNPQLMRLIQEHQADFLRLINEPVEGGEWNIGSQLAAAMPQSVTVTPEEREAIERLEAMGFDRALVLEVFFACNKNEGLAANYLLEHMHEFED